MPSMVREEFSNAKSLGRDSSYHTLAGVIHIVSPPCSMKHGSFEVFHPLEVDLTDVISSFCVSNLAQTIKTHISWA